MNYFKNKIAIVTGGASGIGRALCEELVERGAMVTVADVDLRGAESVASELNRNVGGGRHPARAVHLNVTRADEVQALIDQTARDHGSLDFIFNNAGIAVAGEMRDLSLHHWEAIIDTNLWGVIYGTSAAYRVMAKQGSGHIVNTASLAGLIPAPTMIPYATTKYAVVGLSTSLRAEGADLGVRVSVVCPGFVETNIPRSGTVVNVRSEDMMTQIPFQLMSTKAAARRILRGVARNRAIIVFPLYAWLLWRLTSWSSIPIGLLQRRIVRGFRKFRVVDAPDEK